MMQLEIEQQKLYAGATWKFTETLDEFPASDGYTFAIIIKHKTDEAVFLQSTASGDDYSFNIAADTTRQFTKHDYLFQGIVTKQGEIDIVAEGQLTINPLLDAASDTRTQNERILDAINATLESSSAKEQGEISINGRTIRYKTLDELFVAKKRFEKIVAKEKRIASGKNGIPRLLESY